MPSLFLRREHGCDYGEGQELLGGKLPETADLLFKPEYTRKLKSCGIALWDTPSEMFPILLNYLGKDPKVRILKI